MRALASVVFLALVAGACASPPVVHTERPPLANTGPSASIVTTATAALASATVGIDLPTVLALAGAKPNAIRLAQARLAEAEARLTGAQGALLPSFTLGSSFSRHNDRIQDISGAYLETTRQAFFAGTTGEVLLDLGGNVLGFLRERQTREAIAFDLEAVTQERVVASALGYEELLAADAGVEIARDELEHARGFLAVAASRERNKVGVALDTIRAEANLARARQDLIAAEERARTASIRLATILRLDALVTLRPIEATVRPITFVAPETPAAELVATALASHPALRAQERRVAAAELDDEASHVGPFVPALRAGIGGLNGGLGYNGPELTRLRDREDYYVGLELHLSGLGVGEFARARATDARLRAEQVREDDVRETLIAAVLEAREAVRARGAAIEVAQDELRAAEEARAIAQRRLEQGTGIGIDVLAAEEERTRAATRLITAITGYNSAQFVLLARLGERPGQ